MLQLLHDVCVRYLRLAAVVCLAGGAAGFAPAALALTRVELYQATAPQTDRSEAAQTAAFQAALKTVLIRVTGRRGADEDPAFAPLVSNARRYVQQYRGAPDNQVWVAFDGGAIERWLTQNGQPLWGRDRPSTFVWVSVQTGTATGSVLTAEDTSELKLAIDGAALERGIPLIWPSAAAANTAAASPADLGHHLGAEGVLIGRANNATAAATVHWTLQFGDRSSESAGVQDGVNHAADLYAGMFAASGALAPVEIEVTGVGDLREYAGLQTYLESLTFISHVNVESLTGDTVRFRLTARGGIESLQHAATLSGRLLPAPAGADGVQRFELHR